VPALVAMVVAGRHDVDAADALSRLAGEGGGVGDRVVGLLAEGLEPGGAGAAARRRIAQALADIPGDAATRLLLALTRDEDRGVAVSATYGAGRRGE
ncbi:MerR family transcriptional regulator, partial [Streptomyces sp. NEAU-H3]|nr:MerR family transcriptional regulator [Streptomyces sp. NEAU-H3]